MKKEWTEKSKPWRQGDEDPGFRLGKDEENLAFLGVRAFSTLGR